MNDDIKVNNSLLQLYDSIGENLKIKIIKILAAKNKVASGNLISSVEVLTGERNGTLFIDLFMEDYWYFINYGRRPGKFPPLKKIIEWTRYKGIPESAAFPIARKIALEGFKGIFFLEEAVSQIEKDFEKEITEVWGQEIYLELEEQLKRRLNK
jgi:hypothetical protein